MGGPSMVIAGLDPAIHPFRKKMDARVKPAHDGGEVGDEVLPPRYAEACSVHSSAVADLRAPSATSSRSVVARSAAMLFSSCAVERKPRLARGSLSIPRSVRFFRHSKIVFQTMSYPLCLGAFCRNIAAGRAMTEPELARRALIFGNARANSTLVGRCPMGLSLSTRPVGQCCRMG